MTATVITLLLATFAATLASTLQIHSGFELAEIASGPRTSEVEQPRGRTERSEAHRFEGARKGGRGGRMERG
jgi:hypothetical protein